MAANSAGGAEGEACEDADDGDDGEEFDEGEGRPASLSLGKPCGATQGFNVRRFECTKLRRSRGRVSPAVAGRAYARIFLVERGESGCSHSYDPNFRSQISKGKK